MVLGDVIHTHTHTHTHTSYNVISHKKSEILLIAAMWKYPENIMLSERSQAIIV